VLRHPDGSGVRSALVVARRTSAGKRQGTVLSFLLTRPGPLTDAYVTQCYLVDNGRTIFEKAGVTP
jgi:hypothetical protein